ncbi:MAG: tetrahydrofolate dehydrogenase/cyclohydrolase catalytic domain-containing protein [Bacteroidales bacterium]
MRKDIILKSLIRVKEELSTKVEKHGTLGVFQCGGDANTDRYVRAKTKEFIKNGHTVHTVKLSEETTEEEAVIQFLKLQESCDYIVLQEPNIHLEKLTSLLDRDKDIESIGVDPTTQSVLDILDYMDISRNSIISVCGQGAFGRRIVDSIMKRGNTVFSLNSRTECQVEFRACSDMTVLVFGKGTFKPIPSERIIDVSFNIEDEDSVYNDFYATPMIGGTGRLTTLNLLIKFNELMGGRRA